MPFRGGATDTLGAPNPQRPAIGAAAFHHPLCQLAAEHRPRRVRQQDLRGDRNGASIGQFGALPPVAWLSENGTSRRLTNEPIGAVRDDDLGYGPAAWRHVGAAHAGPQSSEDFASLRQQQSGYSSHGRPVARARGDDDFRHPS